MTTWILFAVVLLAAFVAGVVLINSINHDKH